MKKILLSLVAVVVVLFIGTIGYLYFSLNSLIKKAVETVGPTITRTDVRLASARLSPFSGSGALSGFVIGNPEGYKGPFALKLGSIAVSVDKETLLKDPIVVNSVIIRGPEIALIGTPSGNNLGKLMQNIQSAGSSSKTKEEKPPQEASSKKFVIKEVVISGTKVHLAASALDQKVNQTISIPDIRLQNIGTAGKGISARDVAMQIITPLINAAAKEGINALAKQGLQQLQQQGAKQLGNELNKILPGFRK
ncbi:MAG: hypothetical protein WAL87_02875 [Chthoniobacterales bacterium]